MAARVASLTQAPAPEHRAHSTYPFVVATHGRSLRRIVAMSDASSDVSSPDGHGGGGGGESAAGRAEAAARVLLGASPSRPDGDVGADACVGAGDSVGVGDSADAVQAAARSGAQLPRGQCRRTRALPAEPQTANGDAPVARRRKFPGAPK